MISGLSIGTELKRFARGRIPRAAIAVLVLLPLLYSALYLAAFWDPFGKTSQIPVAFVNDDKGAKINGLTLKAGDQVEDQIRDNHDLDWHFVDDDEATQGLHDGTYHFVVRITPGFSEGVVSPQGADPHQAEMSVTYDQSGNYLSSIIGRTAMQQLHSAVSSAISSQAVDKVLVQVAQASDGIRQAADGAAKLDAGATTLHDGTKEFADKSTELDAGARKLDDGAKKLDQGAGTLANGNHELATNIHAARGGVDQLAGGLGAAVTGAEQLSGGVDRLVAGVGRLGDGARQVSGGVDQLVGTLDGVSQAQGQAVAPLRQTAAQLRQAEAAGSIGSTSSAGVPLSVQLDRLADQLETQGLGAKSPQLADLHRLQGGASQLSSALTDPNGELLSGLGTLQGGAHALDDGLQRLGTGAGTLIDGVAKLDDGAAKLDQGAATLHASTGTLVQGTGTLVDGTGKAVDGTKQLDQGAGKLNDGTGELAGKLGDAATQAPQWTDEHRQEMSNTIGDPVDLQAAYENPAKTFGYGFAPFFIPLALFVGAIIVWILLTPLQTRAVGTRLSPLRVVFASLQPAVLIAAAQAAMILLVLRFGLGLTPSNGIGALAIMAVSAVAFTSLVQMFNIVFGVSVGRVVSMALLMVQLTSADGIYPTVVEPKFFHWIHPFNPITYTVRGLRQSIMGGDPSQFWGPLVVLLAITLGAVAVSTLAANRDRTWTLDRLYPPIRA